MLALENMTSGSNELKSINSPLRMCCCTATGTGGSDSDATKSKCSPSVAMCMQCRGMSDGRG